MTLRFSEIKQLKCPNCDEPFTDFSVMWANAWVEGFEDCSNVFNVGYAKDGPVKICCELCESRWEYNYFAGKVIPFVTD